MKKFSLKSFGLALVVAGVTVFFPVSAFASNDVTTKEGFVPSEDSTWGDLYRYFDLESFATLSPEEKQMFDSTPLDAHSASLTFSNATPDTATAFMEEHTIETENSISTVIPIYPINNIYDKDGIFVEFNKELKTNAVACNVTDNFDGLESQTTYSIHALGMVTPPPGYILSNPVALVKDYTTK